VIDKTKRVHPNQEAKVEKVFCESSFLSADRTGTKGRQKDRQTGEERKLDTQRHATSDVNRVNKRHGKKKTRTERKQRKSKKTKLE